MTACPFKECGEPLYAKGLCVGHYEQQRRHPQRPLRPLHQRRRGVSFAVRISTQALRGLRFLSRQHSKSAYELARLHLERWLEPFGR